MASPLEVATEYGPVEGKEEGGCRVWYGVPYAAPPVGPLRFMPPKPPAEWGPRPLETTKPRAACLQSLNLGVPTAHSEEDCLYLNVYSPVGAGNNGTGLLPVLFWIHGGAFTVGWPTNDNATTMAASGRAVVVSVAYRLGVLGFSVWNSSGGLLANTGLADQQMGLRWTRANIAGFGGDPSRVTIFGESAGGGAGLYHLLNPQSWPFFSRAVLESPGQWGAPPAATLAAAALRYAALKNCTGSPQAVLACMQTLPSSQVLPATNALGSPWGPSNAFVPCVDGVWMTAQPLAMFAGSQWKQCPIMIGWNTVEQNMLGLIEAGTPPSAPLSNDRFSQLVHAIFGAPDDPDSFAPFVLSNYAGERQSLGNWQALAHAFSDWALLHRCPALANKGFLQSPSPVYMYQFRHVPQLWAFTPLGATHTAELAFVFDNPDEQNLVFTSKEKPFAQTVMNAWISFASGQVPLPSWPDYRSAALVQPLDLDFPAAAQYNNSQVCMNWLPLFTSPSFPQPTLFN